MYGWKPEFETPVVAAVNMAFTSLLVHELTDDKGELAIVLIVGPDIRPAAAGDIPKPDDVVDIVKTLWFDDGSVLLADDRSNP